MADAPEEPAAATEYPEPAAAGKSRRKPRRGITFGLFFLVVLAVLIIVVPHHSDRSRTFPPGRWGDTIACLEHNALYSVTGPGGALPGTRTLAVTVTSRAQHTELARLRDAGSAATARAVAHGQRLGRDATAYLTHGSIVWAFEEGGDPPHILANAGDRTLVGFCARTPKPRTR